MITLVVVSSPRTVVSSSSWASNLNFRRRALQRSTCVPYTYASSFIRFNNRLMLSTTSLSSENTSADTTSQVQKDTLDNTNEEKKQKHGNILLIHNEPNERERPLQYHGRIVATPIPDFVTIRARQNDSNVLNTVLLPKNSKYRRSTEKEIDPISIYGTSEIPIDRKNARFGPIYYQPNHNNYHFDWCTNTMNQIANPMTPMSNTTTSNNTNTSSSTTTSTIPPSLLEHKVPLFDEIMDDVPSSHTLSPIPMVDQPTKTHEEPNFDVYQHIPSNMTKLYLYLYRPTPPDRNITIDTKHSSRSSTNGPSNSNTLLPPSPPMIPRKNLPLDFDRQSSEYVMETLQRMSLKLLQQYQQTTSIENSTKIYYSGNRRKQQEISKKILLQKQLNTTTTTNNNNNNNNTKTWNGSPDGMQMGDEESSLSTHYEASVWYITDPKHTLTPIGNQIDPKEGDNTTSTKMDDIDSMFSSNNDTMLSEEATPPMMKELNVANYTNHDLWQLGLQTPLAIIFTLHDANDNLSLQHQQQPPAKTLPKELCFLLETFPPTIHSVNSFDYWSTYLYVGVPITIQVETLYATNTRVDWYVDGIYYQSTYDNTHTYTPITSHLHKKITLLITPYRKYDTTNTDDKIQHPYFNHTGIGCEKAYRFRRLVEPLPINTILDVRNNWLSETRNQRLLHTNDIEANSETNEVVLQRSIRLMTYNILADINAFQVKNRVTMYPYVNKDIMDKTRRMPLILHEVLAYKADVICLQEVDFPVFESLLYPTLQQYGYQGYYSGKQGESTNEGCAMFWSLRTFAPIPKQHLRTVLLRDLVVESTANDANDSSLRDEWSTVNEKIWSLLFRRPDLHMVLSAKLSHIAQMVPLYLLDSTSSDPKRHSPRPIWITNTHLYYHPQASHIRLLQMLFLLRHVHAVLKNTPGELLLCGDLNSSSQTAAGKLILDGTIPENYHSSRVHLNTFRDRSLAPSEEVFLELDDDFPSFTLPDSFPKLRSAINPPAAFTHCTHEFCGTLDHIMCSVSNTGQIRPISSAPMPSVENVTVATGMPSPNIPSDHVSLVSDFIVSSNQVSDIGTELIEKSM